jgi:hypothetical protein
VARIYEFKKNPRSIIEHKTALNEKNTEREYIEIHGKPYPEEKLSEGLKKVQELLGIKFVIIDE